MKKIFLLSFALFSSGVIANDWNWKYAKLPKILKEQVIEQVEAQLHLLENNESRITSNEVWPLSRINIQTFAYLEYDFLFFEAAIKPYVELRWDKKIKDGYVVYQPKK